MWCFRHKTCCTILRFEYWLIIMAGIVLIWDFSSFSQQNLFHCAASAFWVKARFPKMDQMYGVRTQPLFLCYYRKADKSPQRGSSKKISLQVSSPTQTHVPQRPSSFHMSNKIGKFLPRKRARPQIEAANCTKDLCHCTRSRLHCCAQNFPNWLSHF